MTDAPSRTFTWTPAAGDDLFAIPLPFDPRAVFGRAHAPVVVTVNAHTYRSTTTTMGGSPWVPFRKSNRVAAGLDDAASAAVTLTLDTSTRTVEPPADLAAALAEAEVRAGWDRLAFTYQREQVEAVEGAKKPETRARRIVAAVALARSKQPQA